MKRAVVIVSLVSLGLMMGLVLGWQTIARAQTSGAPLAAGRFAVVSTAPTPSGNYPPTVWILDTNSGDLKAFQLSTANIETGGTSVVRGPLRAVK